MGGFQILYIHRNSVNMKHRISFIARSTLHMIRSWRSALDSHERRHTYTHKRCYIEKAEPLSSQWKVSAIKDPCLWAFSSSFVQRPTAVDDKKTRQGWWDPKQRVVSLRLFVFTRSQWYDIDCHHCLMIWYWLSSLIDDLIHYHILTLKLPTMLLVFGPEHKLYLL